MALRSRRSPLTVRVRMRRSTTERTATGIYGLIVTSAVLAASHADSAPVLTIAVLVALATYWSAERYARLVAERIHQGHRLDRSYVWEQLTMGWEMLTASALPLAVVVGLRSTGVPLDTAVTWALVSATLLLCGAGWEIGRHGRLTTAERLVSAGVTGLFGVTMVVLKTALH